MPGQSITLTLADEVDVSRGDVISSAAAPAGVADQFEATITHPKYRVNVNTLERLAAKRATDVHKQARSVQKGQRACVLSFTGLSGAGKSTIANLIEKKLYARGLHTYLLDGDNVRRGLNRDLGFTDEDRVENIRGTWRGPWSRTASSLRSSLTRRSPSPRSGTRKVSTGRRDAAN